MSKKHTLAASKGKASKNGKDAKQKVSDPLPAHLTPAVVEAVLEDVILAAVADEAAQAAQPDTDLFGIPYLGETRRQALALAGLRTRDDLHRATVEQVGGVKGVGMVNAARVKEWLALQPRPSTPVFSGPVMESPDPILAASNQDVQDVFQKLGDAVAHLKERLPAKVRDKALDRQLEKLDTVASELAEGPDTLSARQIQEAVQTLDKIAALLEGVVASEKLSPKKQSSLIEDLRERRKRLQKTLGD